MNIMTKDKFITDDRFCQLSESDVACAGGSKRLAIARLLDEESDTAFCAVLDLDGETVWTAAKNDDGEQINDEDGMPEIEWQSLADFAD